MGLFDFVGNALGFVGGGVGNVVGDAAGPMVAGLTKGITDGFSKAYKDNKAQWKQDALGQIPDIQQATYPGFLSYLNGNGQLPSNMQVNPNSQSLEQLRQTATETGPSAWTQMAMKGVNDAVPGQIGSANQFQKGALSNTENFLKSEGGVSGAMHGALQKQNDLNGMLGSQNIRQNAITQNNDLMLGDAQNKQTALAALPGAELANTQVQQGNIANNLGQISDQNAANMAKYTTQMKSWAQANIAGDTAKSGKK